MSLSRKRLLKEWASVQKEFYPGLEFSLPEPDNILVWRVEMVVNNPNYSELYLLQFKVGQEYPHDAPLVTFISSGSTGELYLIPVHPHIYLNGHICLDLLGSNWLPVHLIASTLVLIQSMLAQNTLMQRPPDDQSYCLRAPSDPKKSHFVYHDDLV